MKVFAPYALAEEEFECIQESGPRELLNTLTKPPGPLFLKKEDAEAWIATAMYDMAYDQSLENWYKANEVRDLTDRDREQIATEARRWQTVLGKRVNKDGHTTWTGPSGNNWCYTGVWTQSVQ